MSHGVPGLSSKFLEELKRRNVVRVALVYLGTAWLIVHVGTVLGENFETPHWVMKSLILLLILGFPIAIGFAWVFELTSQGLKRTKDVKGSRSISHLTGRKLDRLIIGILGLVVLALVVDRFVRPPATEHAAASAHSAPLEQPSVAVLPFANMSTETDNEPFADGLSEEVLNVLAGIQGLKVAGRTSSFYYKGRNEPAEIVARTLKVNHLLEGSVRRSGARVRITAQLIDARSGYHLWSQTFDRQLTDVFAIQEDIARSVANALRVQLLPADQEHLSRRGTQNAEAHALYLTARGRMRERGLENLRAARTLFETAIARDPSYAAAQAGLADSYYLLLQNHNEELDRAEQRGREAADRALALDPKSSEAYASRGNFEQLRYELHGDASARDRALADFRRAVELDPANAQALHWFGGSVLESDPTLALQSFERAIALDPLMRQAQLAAADVIAGQGRYAEARERLAEIIARYPDFGGAYMRAGDNEALHGHFAAAEALLARSYELEKEPMTAATIGFFRLNLGDKAAAADWFSRVGGSPFWDRTRAYVESSLTGRYPEMAAALERRLESETDRGVPMAARFDLILGHPERAAARLLKRFPELGAPDGLISDLNCDGALSLAASWQRTRQEADARELLGRIVRWLDGPLSPRFPPVWIWRAEAHALLGDPEQAIADLNSAYEAGFRYTRGPALGPTMIPVEDNPLLESIRRDPRVTAWLERIRKDNARELAKLKEATPARR
jgi:TolB-like protein/Tfp pilus assembly protein PilF